MIEIAIRDLAFQSAIVAALLCGIPRIQRTLQRWLGGEKDDPIEGGLSNLLILEWGFFFALSFVFVYSAQAVDAPAVWLAISVLMAASIPTYDYVLYPFLLSLRKKKLRPASPTLERWASTLAGARVKVRIYEGALKNAYAVGVLSSSKLVILGRTLNDNLSESSLRAIVAHEVGHLRGRHLLLLYLSSLLGACAFVLGLYGILSFDFPNDWAEGMAVFLGGMLLAGIFFLGLHQYVVTRRLERRADAFGARAVGGDTYARALVHLDELADGRLAAGSMSHPPLDERVRHAKKVSNAARRRCPASPLSPKSCI